MLRPQTLQRIAVLLYVVLFLGDAINVDELFGLKSIQREDDVIAAEQTAAISPSSSLNLLNSLALSGIKPKSHKLKLELVDVDSPSLEASYVSRDDVTQRIHETDTDTAPVSVGTELSFYSLCKLQI